MIYTDNTKKAMEIMFKQHQNQVDKSNTPYVFHPWHVAENQEDEQRTIVALLHDVVEDTDMTLDDLKSEGFDDEVIDALKLLTHKDGEDYYEYVRRLSDNPIAVDVKLADLRHNSDLSRLNKVTEIDLQRVKKYKKCIDFLEKKKKNLNENVEEEIELRKVI